MTVGSVIQTLLTFHNFYATHFKTIKR